MDACHSRGEEPSLPKGIGDRHCPVSGHTMKNLGEEPSLPKGIGDTTVSFEMLILFVGEEPSLPKGIGAPPCSRGT